VDIGTIVRVDIDNLACVQIGPLWKLRQGDVDHWFNQQQPPTRQPNP